MTPAAALALASGLGFGLSLIAAIGAQNAFLLRQGLLREHVLPVVAVCAISDAVLIAAGIAGLGSLLDVAPRLVDVMRIGGAAFLLSYAALAARRAWRPSAMSAGVDESRPVWPVVTTAVALTWLNPHVYLDTLVLLGSVAATHGDDRWWFGLGATVASAVWFTSLGYGASLLRPVFARPGAWRALDATIAVVMVAIAVTLLHGLMES